MTRYEKTVWQMIEEVRKELPSTFAPRDVILKVKAKHPDVLDQTIRAHVIALSPNHPSSKHYSLQHKMFFYLGNGRYRNLDAGEKEILTVETHTTRPIHSTSGTSKMTLDRMNQRVEKMSARLTYYIEQFDQAQRFSGPSQYFHFKTLERLNQHQRFAEVFEDDLFFDYLYATLASWGLHHMGPKGSKLVDLQDFKTSLRSNRNRIEALHNIRLTDLTQKDSLVLTDALWDILKNIKVSATKTNLVANTKTLHHLLPQLVPPVDREYTLKFFYNNKQFKDNQGEIIFRTIYPYIIQLAQTRHVEIQKIIGNGFHTSETKVIDNAIVGYVLTEIKKPRGA